MKAKLGTAPLRQPPVPRGDRRPHKFPWPGRLVGRKTRHTSQLYGRVLRWRRQRRRARWFWGHWWCRQTQALEQRRTAAGVAAVAVEVERGAAPSRGHTHTHSPLTLSPTSVFLSCTENETDMGGVLGIREGYGDGRWQSFWWVTLQGALRKGGPGANTPPPHPKRYPGGHPIRCGCHHVTRKKIAMARSTEGMERTTWSERYGASGTERTVRSEVERD